jgi:ligand-binding SRPBCC domain-containing protein
MTTLELETEINSPARVCFDLARSIEIHLESTKTTREIVVAGRSSGLCELGDQVTWEATHFGIRQRLSVAITKMESPFMFEDEMLTGTFKSMKHEHRFEECGRKTIMKDIFQYEVPYGIWGRLFDTLILKKYMTRFLLIRNAVIKSKAERLAVHVN